MFTIELSFCIISDISSLFIRTSQKIFKNYLRIDNTNLSPEDVAKTVKYVFDLPHEITIPSIEVRHIKNY